MIFFYFFLVNPSTTLDKHTDGGCQAELASIQKWNSGALFPGGLAACYIPHGTLSRKELLDPNTHRSCNPNTAANEGGGNACAALIMKDNWKISPDYPW